ncbi:hypothetical protein HYB67_002925 [Salmonella enterica subsp. enterica serovar Sandiego]|nr:hypothetical protein [Salmonella enterica]EEO9933270.1 hypothetical protein [Salmonella enterica subsp. enterica serovar Sandiego]EFS0315557.1 hypothetical protein [Salmonella enterica subsp. enterica serovar Sandiego]
MYGQPAGRVKFSRKRQGDGNRANPTMPAVFSKIFFAVPLTGQNTTQQGLQADLSPDQNCKTAKFFIFLSQFAKMQRPKKTITD